MRYFADENKDFVQVMVILDAYVSGGHRINTALLWKYDMKDFDWQKSRTIVAQRAVELGTPEDFYGAFDLYGGIEEFREILKSVPYLNELDQHFVCTFFNLKKRRTQMLYKETVEPGTLELLRSLQSEPELEKFNRLMLDFTDKVTLPTWMDKLTIESFTISGKMTEEEKAEIQKRFPKAVIRNN